MENVDLHEKIRDSKKRLLDFCIAGGYGHPSSAYALTEILSVLYYNVLRYDIHNPNWPDRDRFILSNNHASIMLFPMFNDIGFISDEEYKTIMKEGSERTSHTNCKFAGMEFTGGALGIGLGIAVGIAKAAQMDKKEYMVFCVVGDAECCEGSVWESVMFAGHNHLNNLVVIVDNNNMGVSDFTSNMIAMEPIEEKWAAFGFDTLRVNGHDIDQLNKVFSDIRYRKSNKPLCIVADTIKGHGLSFMENKLMWHGTLPKGDNIDVAYKELEEC